MPSMDCAILSPSPPSMIYEVRGRWAKERTGRRSAPQAGGAPEGPRRRLGRGRNTQNASLPSPVLYEGETGMHGMGSGRQGSRLVNDASSFSPSSREAPGASELHPKHRAGRGRSPLARPASAQPSPVPAAQREAMATTVRARPREPPVRLFSRCPSAHRTSV